MSTEEATPTQNQSSLGFRIVLSVTATLLGAMMIVIAPGATKPWGHYLIGAFCLAIAAVCFARGRLQGFIGSLIAATVLISAGAYLVTELDSGPPISGSIAQPSILNAALAMLAFGIPAAIYLWRVRFGLRKLQPTGSLHIDDVGVRRTTGKTSEEIRWADITQIMIMTTNDGPYAEDVFFALVGAGETGCLIPHSLAVEHKLLEQLQTRFPALDNRAVTLAMGSTGNANFILWQKSDLTLTKFRRT